ncbi:hypothetical protein FNV43_RR02617 [Rhamnella rubrinervis]|uniref:Uncharacterized protein n=1 Tax=Rhamnella rubrinervis TaxID=2594499 RepID=A0A8K0MU25_9ROSA|nr:hypothetical protein FNV43_RR02617 [Rhamnella rubrinervis]
MLLSFLLLFVSSASCMALPQRLPCTDHKFPDGKSFVACKDSTLLSSFLYWNYYPSLGTADIAFRKIGESNDNLDGLHGLSILPQLEWLAHRLSWLYGQNFQSDAAGPGNLLKGASIFNLDAWLGHEHNLATNDHDGLEWYPKPSRSSCFIGQRRSARCYGTSLQKGNLSFPVYDISALSDGKIETSKGGNTKKKATIKNVHGFLNAIMGYGTIILGIINICKGLDILEAGKSSVLRIAFSVTIIALGCIAAVLEAVTWILVWMRKKAAVEVEAGCVTEDGTSSPTGRVAAIA